MMSTIHQMLIVLAARVLSLITGAALEYEVYSKPRWDESFGPVRSRSEGFYSGTKSECKHYIAEEIRVYHKVLSGYGVRPTGQLILEDDSALAPGSTTLSTQKG